MNSLSFQSAAAWAERDRARSVSERGARDIRFLRGNGPGTRGRKSEVGEQRSEIRNQRSEIRKNSAHRFLDSDFRPLTSDLLFIIFLDGLGGLVAFLFS